LIERLRAALTQNEARTDPEASDPALRGRTYAIPFDHVWRGVVDLAAGGMRGWSLVSADDQTGLVEAEVQARLSGTPAQVRVRVGLDANAQTRVDAESRSARRSPDLGANRRRIDRFMAALDVRLGARAPAGSAPRPGVPTT